MASVSKSKEAAQRRMLVNTNVDNSCSVVSKENDFLTQKEQKQIFSNFLVTRQKEKRHLHRTKQLHERELLNNFEEKIESDDEPEDYSGENDNDEFDDSEMR